MAWAESLEASIREGRHFPHAAAKRTSFDALAMDYIETVLAEFDPKEIDHARPPAQLVVDEVRGPLIRGDHGGSHIEGARQAPGRALRARPGGLRKVRWSGAGRGKRGGTRVIYFHVASQDQIRLLLIYRKGVKDDLWTAEKKIPRKLNEDW